MPKHDPYQKPKYFPVYLDEFLRLVVGGKYKRKREYTYRAFLIASDPNATPVQIEAILERDRVGH
jgi:hypothetical protein